MSRFFKRIQIDAHPAKQSSSHNSLSVLAAPYFSSFDTQTAAAAHHTSEIDVASFMHLTSNEQTSSTGYILNYYTIYDERSPTAGYQPTYEAGPEHQVDWETYLQDTARSTFTLQHPGNDLMPLQYLPVSITAYNG